MKLSSGLNSDCFDGGDCLREVWPEGGGKQRERGGDRERARASDRERERERETGEEESSAYKLIRGCGVERWDDLFRHQCGYTKLPMRWNSCTFKGLGLIYSIKMSIKYPQSIMKTRFPTRIFFVCCCFFYSFLTNTHNRDLHTFRWIFIRFPAKKLKNPWH